MTIFERLEEDHQHARQLLDQLLAAGSKRSRERLFGQLKQELDVHAMFEEEVFYPAIAEAEDAAQEEMDQAVEQHDEVTSLLENLNEMDLSSDEAAPLLDQLATALDQHIQEEETELFDLAREIIDDERAAEMAEQYDAAKKEFLQDVA